MQPTSTRNENLSRFNENDESEPTHKTRAQHTNPPLLPLNPKVPEARKTPKAPKNLSPEAPQHPTAPKPKSTPGLNCRECSALRLVPQWAGDQSSKDARHEDATELGFQTLVICGIGTCGLWNLRLGISGLGCWQCPVSFKTVLVGLEVRRQGFRVASVGMKIPPFSGTMGSHNPTSCTKYDFEP